MRHAIKAAGNGNNRMNHGAVVIRGGRLLGVGWNKSRVHNQWVLNQSRLDCTVHAEMAAIRGISVRGATVVVVRLRKDGLLGSSKPCDACWSALESAGIRRVVYS